MTGGTREHSEPAGADGPDPAVEQARALVEDVARTSYGRLVAYLASTTRDIAAAEDALSAAFVAALSTWPERGVPARPDAWLLTAARRSLIDASRRRDTARRALPDLARLVDDGVGTQEGSAVPDVRLQLMFACTHPAVDPAVRSPLMLQTVLGLDAVRIGAVFLVPATTMGQRLVRAKTKIGRAGVPFAVPPDAELPARVGAVLDAVYAAYTAGWDDSADGSDGTDVGDDLVEEALRLARVVVQLLPDDPEAAGLLALLLHSHARRGARRDDRGAFVPLAAQDTARWSAALMTEAEEHLSRAAAARRPGAYQLMAAIQSVHNRRALTGRSDHAAVAQLYDGLAVLTPTVGVLVARAAATLADARPAEALRRLDALDAPGRADVAGYQPYWATRAAVLDALGDPGAAAVRAQAVRLAADPAVRAHLGA